MMKTERLDKIIAAQLNISRSLAREGIKKGLAKIDGKAVCDPAFKTEPEKNRICFDGQAVGYQKYIYIVMNKPKGVLSASQDRKKQTVIDLIPPELRRKNLFPVGRLDRDTTGLLIITDDGDFAHRVLSPSKEIYKTYVAELDGKISQEIVEKFARGVILADGTPCRKAILKPLGGNFAEIKICEGKYHQIKRMFGTVGLGVNKLERIAVGGFKLPENIAYGECKQVTLNNLFTLFSNNF